MLDATYEQVRSRDQLRGQIFKHATYHDTMYVCHTSKQYETVAIVTDLITLRT